MKHKLVPVSVVAVLAIAPLFARRFAARPVTVTIAVSALRISQPLFVAIDQGLFERHGVRAQVVPYNTAQPMLDDVALGRVDVGGFVAWPIVLNASTRSARPLRVATTMVEDASHRVSYVLARRGEGLRFPQDLPGKRVGILPTIAYRRWLVAISRAASIDPASFTIVNVEPSMQATMLAGRSIDLLFTNDPMATAMLQRSIAEVVDDGPPCARRLSPSFSFGTVALSPSFVERSPALARAVVAALDEAISITHREPRTAQRAMLPFLRELDRPFVAHYPAGSWQDSSRTAGALAAEIDAERRMQILERTPNVLAFEAQP